MTAVTFSDWRRLWRALHHTGAFGPTPAKGAATLLRTLLRHGPTPYTLVTWHAARQPDALLIEAADGKLSYREALAQADQLIRRLAPTVRPGARVGLLGRGGAHWLVGLLAAARLGAEVVLMNTLHSPADWATQARALGLSAVLHEPAYGRALRQHPHPAALVELSESRRPGVERSRKAVLDSLTPRCLDKALPPRFGSVTLLTSGSTGTPRAIRRRTGLSRLVAVRTGADFLSRLAPRAGERVWLPPPLFHGHGLSALMLTLGFGGTLILAGPEELWSHLHAANPDWAVLVPTMLCRLLDAADGPAPDRLRRVVSGSAPLAPRLAARAQQTFGPVLLNLYGTTETGPIALATPEDLRVNPASVGRVLDGVQLELKTGTVRVRSPFLAVPTPLWDTRDLGRLDPAGRLMLAGRADDRLICGGENVDPEVLEGRMAALPDIRECAVWGEDDPEYGQVLHALIVPQAAGVSAAELQEALNAALPRTLRPRSVTLCAELPRNAAGKIARRELKNWATAIPVP